MPDTVKTPPLDFVIDSSQDSYYRLLISDHADTRPFIHDIPLENINSVAVRELEDPTTPHTVLEALLIPTNDAETVSVVVGTTVVGTLPDPSVVSNSQIARVYASGLIPTCKLVLAPAAEPEAYISLYKSDGGVPLNDPPTHPWTLLPDGSMWRVEPTRHSPFINIRDESRVLVELRALDDIIFIYLNGRECGILGIDAADALRGAVQTAVKDGFIPVARGCVERRDDDTISLHINALAFPLWQREDFRLRHNPLPRLVPYQRNPLLYRAGVHQFIQCHKRAPQPSPARHHTMLERLHRHAPLVLILLAVLSFLPTISADLSARGVVGLLGISVVLAVLGLWILGCRKYDTAARKQPRRWEMALPLALSVLIPSTTFASVGFFHDTDASQQSDISAQSTTLQPFPHTQDLLVARPPGSSDTPPGSNPESADTPGRLPVDQDVPSWAPTLIPTLTTPAEREARPEEPSPRLPDAPGPLIWAGGAQTVSPDDIRPVPSTGNSDTPPPITAPEPPVPANPVLPDTITIIPPVPDMSPPPGGVFLPNPIGRPNLEVPIWPEDPPIVTPPAPTPPLEDPEDVPDSSEVEDPSDPQGIAPDVSETASPSDPVMSTATPPAEESPTEPSQQEGTVSNPSTGQQSPPEETDLPLP